MSVRTRSIEYAHDDVALQGDLAWDDAWTSPRPGILVVHDALKSKAGFERARAEALVELGYVGLAIDVYGKGVFSSSPEEAGPLMAPFREDRRFLFQRLLASVRAAEQQPEVDENRLAAIGYCFGGMCVLDMARMGAPLAGVVSFHGLLISPDDGVSASDDPITARVLVLHGWDDPFVPEEQVTAFAREMGRRGADWQLLALGGVQHSFSNPFTHDPKIGAVYDEQADRRSWSAMSGFLAELFPESGAP